MKLKRFFRALFVIGMLTLTASSGALAKDAEVPLPPLLDGTEVIYYYQNGWGAHVEFYDGKLRYKWIAGPHKGNGDKDLVYKSRKVGEHVYLISWLEESHPDYMTLLFNFGNNVMYSSGILRFATKNQSTVFDGGTIQKVKLVVKE